MITMATPLSATQAKLWLLFLRQLIGRRSLTINITREICSYISDFSGELVQVTDTSIHFFNWQASVWGPRVLLSALIRADDSSTWVVLEDGSLFCSGGGKHHTGASLQAWNEAYLLSRIGAVRKLGLMVARAYHGVIQTGHIYLFGGCTS